MLRKELWLQQKSLQEIIDMYLYGASGHAKVIIDILNSVIERTHILGIYDDFSSEKELCGIKILGPLKDEKSISSNKFLISIGDNKTRKRISEKLQENFFKAIHSSAIISNNSKIGEGSAVMQGAIINSGASIGKHCIINSGAIIEHDCEIEDFVHISPGTTLTGNVTVGEGTHLGAGAVVIPNIKIGRWCVIGAGAVIIENVPDFCTVVGNPGKIIKNNRK